MNSLINCDRCGSDACMVDEVNQDIKTYMCFGCGFQSNSLMREGEEFYETQLQSLPEIYKDLITEDKSGKRWIPSTINVPDKGMIFANGPSVDDWNWSAVKSVRLTEEDKKKDPVLSKNANKYDYKMDMSTIKHFAERDFIDALSYIGIIP
jgi:ribosomal protein L37E